MLHFFAYAEIIFAHILAFPACAIEVQHTNENSPTIAPPDPLSVEISTIGVKTSQISKKIFQIWSMLAGFVDLAW